MSYNILPIAVLVLMPLCSLAQKGEWINLHARHKSDAFLLDFKSKSLTTLGGAQYTLKRKGNRILSTNTNFNFEYLRARINGDTLEWLLTDSFKVFLLRKQALISKRIEKQNLIGKSLAFKRSKRSKEEHIVVDFVNDTLAIISVLRLDTVSTEYSWAISHEENINLVVFSGYIGSSLFLKTTEDSELIMLQGTQNGVEQKKLQWYKTPPTRDSIEHILMGEWHIDKESDEGFYNPSTLKFSKSNVIINSGHTMREGSWEIDQFATKIFTNIPGYSWMDFKILHNQLLVQHGKGNARYTLKR